MGTPWFSAVWRDTTHDTICAFFRPKNEPEEISDIYETIRGVVGNTYYGMMLILECLCSIPKRSWEKNGKPLPEDVVFDILSRLPAEDILNCRMVCKRWMSLTLTPRFLDVHLVRAPPMILLHKHVSTNDLWLYSIDLTPEEPCIKIFDKNKLRLHSFPCHFGGTCDGLVLLWEAYRSFLRLYICSPLEERILMKVPAKGFLFCGFWFNPTKRAYLFLTASRSGDEEDIPDENFRFRIFDLRGKSTELGLYCTVPSDDVPISINGSLYYLLRYPVPPNNCIMIFDINSEKIEFKPHPHNDHCGGVHNGFYNPSNVDMCLLEVDGSLGFTHVCSSLGSLYIWILADRASWLWTLRYNIDLNWDPSTGAICALSGIHNAEMLMHFHYSRLFAVNLETRRVRKINIAIGKPRQFTFLTTTTCARSLVGVHRLDDFRRALLDQD